MNRNQMIEENLGLVGYIVAKLGYGGDDDKFQTGCIGLIKAVDTFDKNKGYTFATYASRCITNEIFMGMRVENRQIFTVSLSTPIEENLELGDMIAYNDEQKFRISDLKLSEREEKILRLYINGLNQCEISRLVNLSQSYVSRILIKIKRKMEVLIYDE